jgi:hypothetical protein
MSAFVAFPAAKMRAETGYAAFPFHEDIPWLKTRLLRQHLQRLR